MKIKTTQIQKMKIKNTKIKNFAAAILAIILASCSSSENTADTTPAVTQLNLPRKITSGANVTIINYNGNKITEVINSSNEKKLTTYTGDLITKQEIFINNVSNIQNFYTYEGGKLKTYYKKIAGSNLEYTTNYTHNTTNTTNIPNITYVEKTKDVTITAPNSESISKTGQIFIINGNVTKEIISSTIGPYSYVTTKTYEYDTKNNLNLNILGFNLLINDGSSCSVNNVIKITTLTESTLNGVVETPYTFILTAVLVYNSNNYPTECQQFSGISSIPKIFIEY